MKNPKFYYIKILLDSPKRLQFSYTAQKYTYITNNSRVRDIFESEF
jgi:hypothetical protein